MVQSLLEVTVKEPHSQSTPRGRPNSQTIKMMQL